MLASASAMTALQTLKSVIYSGPRRLTESEIVLLRQSKAEVARRVRQLIVESKDQASPAGS
jgi:hypothetical protein